MTDMATGAAVKSARRRKVAPVTASALAQHLGVSRQYVARLADEQTIVRQDDGLFDQDAARLAYLNWLRSPERRSARSAADSKFTEAKTTLLEIRMQEKLGKLVPVEVLEDSVDIIVGMYRTELVSLPARFTRDVRERHRLEGLIRELLRRVANEAGRRAGNVTASEGDGKTEAFGLDETDADA